MRAVIAISLLLAGCGGDSLADRAAEARELWWAFYPEHRTISLEQWRAEVTAEVDLTSDDELRDYAETYGRLGFFPVDLDLRPILVDSQSSWVGGFYRPDDGTITAIGEADDDVLVHEYVHALQDQHFGIERFVDSATTDRFLTRVAILEGDAVLAQYRFSLQELGTDLELADWRYFFSVYRNTADALLTEAAYPVVFLDTPTFCYRYGLELAAYNLLGVTFDDPSHGASPPYDWGRENQLFFAPPVSTTEQVIGFATTVDPGEPIGLAEVPDAFTDRLASVDWDQLGEWYAYLLFYGAGRGAETSQAIAAGWDGDTALFVRDRQNGRYGAIWASAWDDANVAVNVVDTLWTLYGGNPAPAQAAASGIADDGDPVFVERRDHRVVVIKNLADDLVAPLADAAFATPTRRRPARSRPSLAARIAR